MGLFAVHVEYEEVRSAAFIDAATQSTRWRGSRTDSGGGIGLGGYGGLIHDSVSNDEFVINDGLVSHGRLVNHGEFVNRDKLVTLRRSMEQGLFCVRRARERDHCHGVGDRFWQ